MSSLNLTAKIVLAVALLSNACSCVRAGIIQQGVGDEFLVVEAEDYDFLRGGLDKQGFLIVTTTDPMESPFGSPILPKHSNASGGAALFDQPLGVSNGNTATWKLQFATPGLYTLYLHYSMFDIGTPSTYTGENSFYLALGFDQSADQDFHLDRRDHDRSEVSPFWEGNFHWQTALRYFVPVSILGTTVDFNIATREKGSTLDMFVFHRDRDLNEEELDQFVRQTDFVELQPGDADQDLDFDQFDLIQVQIAFKYRTGLPATWGEGDWNGTPNGRPGNPRPGDGLFNQLDIIAALLGGTYLTGPYASIASGGTERGSQTSVVYNADSGEIRLDAPIGTELTSINIDSTSGIFTAGPARNLGGSFDNDTDNNIFKATFGSSFSSLSFGSVAPSGLSKAFLMDDLTVVGSMAGGGNLGPVDLIYVPEPSACVLARVGALVLALYGMRSRSR